MHNEMRLFGRGIRDALKEIDETCARLTEAYESGAPLEERGPLLKTLVNAVEDLRAYSELTFDWPSFGGPVTLASLLCDDTPQAPGD